MQAGSWDEAQQAVSDLQARGGLNEGVVEAAVMALEKARDMPAPPGRDKTQLIAVRTSVHAKWSLQLYERLDWLTTLKRCMSGYHLNSHEGATRHLQRPLYVVQFQRAHAVDICP